MQRSKISPCGRFMVVDGLHLDRIVFQVLEQWAADRGLQVQDAIQLAVCTLTEREIEAINKLPAA